MAVTYQDVVRANGGIASWAFAEAAGATLAPWLGGQSLTVTGTLDYLQPGPFAASEAIKFHAGAKVGFATPVAFLTPITWEAWVKFDALPTSGNQIIWFNGNNGSGGAGVLVYPAGLVQWYTPAGPTSTGKSITAGGWHLFTFSIEANNSISFYLDGAFVWRGNPAASNANPLQLNYGGDSANTNAWPFSIAYPAIYGRVLTPEQAYSTFLAATDPTSALAWSATPGPLATSDVLQAILAAVTYRAY